LDSYLVTFDATYGVTLVAPQIRMFADTARVTNVRIIIKSGHLNSNKYCGIREHASLDVTYLIRPAINELWTGIELYGHRCVQRSCNVVYAR